MRIPSRYWLIFCVCVAIWSNGCTPVALQPRDVDGVTLEPGRYLQKYYRSLDFDPATAVYQIEAFPVEQVIGISPEEAAAIFNAELLKAMTANGLKVNVAERAGLTKKPAAKPGESKTAPQPEPNRSKPDLSLVKPQSGQVRTVTTVTMSGVINRIEVASPTWRFFAGRAQADLRVSGEIRRGNEIVFAFLDEVKINPPVNPKHRPPLESDLIVRLVIHRFTENFLNELLLPAKNAGEADISSVAPSKP